MVYMPREGEHFEIPAGQPVFTFHSGPLYLLAGQVRYKLENESEPFFYTVGAGSLIGLEQSHMPPAMLKCNVLEPVRCLRWTLQGLETYLGKDIQFALIALISLSQQQRRLNQELARRAEAKALAMSQLKSMAEQNIQAGNAGMAQAIYQQMVGTSPQHDLTASIREALAQMKREQEGLGPLEVSTDMPSLNQETQLSLYQLAFGGMGQLNEDILHRFGRNYAAGDCLCREGDDGSELFLILKGSVEASRKGQILGTSSEGELVGEMAVLEGKPRSATVIALSETITLALNREHFQMIFQLHPSWTWKLLEAFSHRIANCYQLLAREI